MITTQPGSDGRETQIFVDGVFFGVIYKGTKDSSDTGTHFYTSQVLLAHHNRSTHGHIQISNPDDLRKLANIMDGRK